MIIWLFRVGVYREYKGEYVYDELVGSLYYNYRNEDWHAQDISLGVILC